MPIDQSKIQFDPKTGEPTNVIFDPKTGEPALAPETNQSFLQKLGDMVGKSQVANAQAQQAFGDTAGPALVKAALPTLGAIGGGVGGGYLGTAGGPLGTFAGSVAGAGAGASAGEAGNQLISNLVNHFKNGQVPQWNPSQIGKQGIYGMAGEGAGQLIGAGLQAAAGLGSSSAQGATEGLGSRLADIFNPPKMVQVGDQSINVPKLMLGTNPQQDTQIALANKPSMDILKGINPTVPAAANSSVSMSPAYARQLKNTIQDALDTVPDSRFSQSIDPDTINTLDQAVDKNNLLAKLKSMRGNEELSPEEIETMAQDPKTYENMLGSLSRRINAGKNSGPGFEDLLNNNSRNLIFKQEMALKRGGLLPQDQMGQLAGVQSDLGDLQTAMKQAMRNRQVDPNLFKGYLAPQQYEARGAEMIGRTPSQGLAQALGAALYPSNNNGGK